MGAEPLGLLRWADLGVDGLCNALESEFAGVGEPEFIRLLKLPPEGRAEYWCTDTRHHMAMRTFVHVDEMAEDAMLRQLSQRLRFLRRKLVDCELGPCPQRCQILAAEGAGRWPTDGQRNDADDASVRRIAH